MSRSLTERLERRLRSCSLLRRRIPVRFVTSGERHTVHANISFQTLLFSLLWASRLPLKLRRPHVARLRYFNNIIASTSLSAMAYPYRVQTIRTRGCSFAVSSLEVRCLLLQWSLRGKTLPGQYYTGYLSWALHNIIFPLSQPSILLDHSWPAQKVDPRDVPQYLSRIELDDF